MDVQNVSECWRCCLEASLVCSVLVLNGERIKEHSNARSSSIAVDQSTLAPLHDFQLPPSEECNTESCALLQPPRIVCSNGNRNLD